MKQLTVWTLAALLIVLTGCNRSPNASNRSDSQVAADVQGKINADGNLPNKQITVNANNGVVSLSGNVGSETERMSAANDAAQIDGVKTVVNNLTVAPSASAAMTPDASTQSTQTQALPPQRPSQRREMPRRTNPPSNLGRSTNEGASTASDSGSRGSVFGNSNQPAPVITSVTVPAGTNLSIRLIDGLDTARAQPGDQFSATLDSPVYVDDRIAIPANADVRGRVVDAKGAGKFEGSSQLSLELTNVNYGGKSYRINTARWTRTGAARGKNTAAKVGGGAALGAIIGAIAGGGKGAAIGAGVGAGAGTGAQAITHGEQIVVKPETLLSFNLTTPITVMPSAGNDNPNRRRLGSPDNNN